MTEDNIKEFTKCAQDFNYFLKYCMVDGKPLQLTCNQENWVRSFKNDKVSIVTTDKGTGKSLITAAYMLHYCIFSQTPRECFIIDSVMKKSNRTLEVIKEIHDYLPNYMHSGIKHNTKQSMIFHNYSEINIGSANIDTLRGRGVDFLLIENMDDMVEPFSILTVFRPMLHGKQSKLVMTFNNDSEYKKTIVKQRLRGNW